jgi:hypothetical protein
MAHKAKSGTAPPGARRKKASPPAPPAPTPLTDEMRAAVEQLHRDFGRALKRLAD